MPIGTGLAVAQGVGAAAGEIFGGGETELEEAQRLLFEAKLRRGSLLFNQLSGELKDPSQFLRQTQTAIAPQLNQLSAGLSRDIGLDSDAARGELARGSLSLQTQGLINRNQDIRRIQAGLAR